MAFEDFLKTPVVLMRKGVKDKWSDFTYSSTDVMGRLQKTEEWNVSENLITAVRRGVVYFGPTVDVKAGDKLKIDEEEFLVDDVSFVRNRDGVLHHLEVSV